ncbi:hypothetical protein A3709_19175 [Halioglobus sp. HI00S01]|uniref:DUF4942 domain-containing protein n=1 Tax=Halioglobus sp. HI00S01 TaxID=1822214 RepID=UPI0007C23968|nr:DUF4942 domain-containing protein [Halioglobus sp. HI00S01]KZX57747.1 hypothetical protein A3709_19175 [Halioglobus sp. HI00S01]
MGAEQKISSRQMIQSVAGTDQDFEWYPTTTEIIETIAYDLSEVEFMEKPSMLDVGAGDGRVLKALGGAKYAIEKSRPLLDSMDPDIFIVGTEFSQQTLIDKKVNTVFSNPPYSEFDAWATRIIREANAALVYLVIPSRWSDSKTIQGAIEARNAVAEVIGEFDFHNADRQARAHVNIVKISLRSRGRGFHGLGSQRVDPFDLWFDENFDIAASQSKRSSWEDATSNKQKLEEALAGELVPGADLAVVLEKLYIAESAKLVNTYKQLETLDADLLQEMDINLKGVREALRQKYESLKDRYWGRLFSGLDRITSRLTAQGRQKMLDKVMANTHVDFTISNAYAIIIWCIKNANSYFDSQLTEAMERLVSESNIELYKSNQRTFGASEWRYNCKPEGLDRFKLDYRIVYASGWSGICTDPYPTGRVKQCNLTEHAIDLLDDLRTIASNLGFDTSCHPGAVDHWWESNKKVEFMCTNGRTGDVEVIFEAKAFKNGNLHIKFNQDCILRMNVEFGRLKGWVQSAAEAAEELGVSPEAASEAFGANLRLDSTLKLGTDQVFPTY